MAERLKIASWNINSVRARIGLVERLIDEQQPDILCLQETKVLDGIFPADPFKARGYVHVELNGQRMHHGVAILSRVELRDSGSNDWQDNGEARHVGVRLPCGLRLENVYVPAGGDIPDPKLNDKFAHKLHFLREMEKFFATRRRQDPVILVGDLNVAPLENDVWSHKQLLNIVSHTPVETNLLHQAQAAFDWIDSTRHFIPPEEKIYSWWSYRAQDWEASDRGRRLDHIWASQGLKGVLKSHRIVKKMRGWQKASDHVPVVVEFDI